MKITNQLNNLVLAENALVADNFFARLKGLLGKESLAPGQALVLKPGNSIHTCFMRFPIDIAFIDKNNKVIKTINSLRPFRFSAVYFSSALVVELPSGTLEKTNTHQGDTLEFD